MSIWSNQHKLLSCCQVQRGTASQIVNAIERAVKTVMDWKDFRKKLVALGSDGASVKLGQNNGVIAKLQEMQPAVIAVHCSGHRLELAYKDSIKKVQKAEKVITMLTGLFYFYRTAYWIGEISRMHSTVFIWRFLFLPGLEVQNGLDIHSKHWQISCLVIQIYDCIWNRYKFMSNC